MNAAPLNYQDQIRIIKPNYDGYGSETVGDEATIPALFVPSSGWTHGGNTSQITSDAVCYVDPTHPFVTSNANRLEGMLIVANPFGYAESESWYRVVGVDIGIDKLLTNQIDNVMLSLNKTTEIENVS